MLGRIACQSLGQHHDCRLRSFETDALADGIFNDDQGFLIAVGELAKNFPGEPSDIAAMLGFPPGTTNLQLLNVFAVLPAPGQTFHVFGGTFDEMGFPVPVFTPQALLVAQATSFVPSLPVQFDREIAQVGCSVEPVSDLDGGLGDIIVPVLHIGAAGAGLCVRSQRGEMRLGKSKKVEFTDCLIHWLIYSRTLLLK